jgi:HAE1 family hydrophobic/amphiphilic exporter-1
MARAVIGGLITSTILTLIVVPVVYTYLDDAGDRFERWWTPKGPEPKSMAARAGQRSH